MARGERTTRAELACLFAAYAAGHTCILALLASWGAPQPQGPPWLQWEALAAHVSLLILESTLIYDNILLSCGAWLCRTNGNAFAALSKLRFLFHGGLLPLGAVPVLLAMHSTFTPSLDLLSFEGALCVLLPCIGVAAEVVRGGMHAAHATLSPTDAHGVFRLTSKSPNGKPDFLMIVPAIVLTLLCLCSGVALLFAGQEGATALLSGSIIMFAVSGAPGAAGFLLSNFGEACFMLGLALVVQS